MTRFESEAAKISLFSIEFKKLRVDDVTEKSTFLTRIYFISLFVRSFTRSHMCSSDDLRVGYNQLLII